mmetsp:Transcript_31307/g.71478  ORF Transcript_31307/g.71478 Transcript_31307/m.71478 type:complete len:402 (+) Transcript_31307:37-1242(+)
MAIVTIDAVAIALRVSEGQFIEWARGQLQLEPKAKALIFSPTQEGKQQPSAKHLGCFRGCAQESALQFLVHTDAAVHSELRLSVASCSEAQAFLEWTEKALQESQPTHFKRLQKEMQSESEFMALHRRSLSPRPPVQVTPSTAAAQPSTHLVYRNVCVFEESPFNGHDEVYVGEGQLHFLDASDGSCVGCYALQVYDGVDLLCHVVLAPHMWYRLLHSVGHQEPSHAQAKVVLEDELSPNKAFIFDNQEAAHAFARDLHVRLQVMHLARKANVRAAECEDLENQLWSSYESGLIPVIRSLLPYLCIIIVLVLSLHGGSLVYANPDRGLMEPLGETLQVSRNLAAAGWEGLERYSHMACAEVTSTVRSSAVEHCASLSNLMDLRRCIDDLVQRTSMRWNSAQ